MFKTFFDAVKAAHFNRIRRNALTHLSDRALADIGLTRDQAQDDYLHGIWDAPQTWKAPSARGAISSLPRMGAIY